MTFDAGELDTPGGFDSRIECREPKVGKQESGRGDQQQLVGGVEGAEIVTVAGRNIEAALRALLHRADSAKAVGSAGTTLEVDLVLDLLGIDLLCLHQMFHQRSPVLCG